MNREVVAVVRERAGNRCEYCLIHQSDFPLRFQIDHIIAEQHGGTADEENLALACPRCNRYKGPNIAGVDPDTSEVTRLFNPRQDRWSEHFRFDAARIIGATSVGRATVRALAVNASDMLTIRAELLEERKSLLPDT